MFATLAILASSGASAGEVVIYQFSDYHSHARPFFSEGKKDQGGIARVIGYLRARKKAEPEAILVNGGDMMNVGSPAWSDKHRCAEWSWFNGLLDAMALGNHEFDYGYGVFKACADGLDYPILGSNLFRANEAHGQDPFLLNPAAKRTTLVLERAGARIGLFALAGSDFARLVKPQDLPPGTHFENPFQIAKETVAILRENERCGIVALIGHQSYEESVELAKSVPGIDLILGTHSHRKQPLTRIPGTSTWLISPYQYMAYVSKVSFAVKKGRMANPRGELIPIDASVPAAKDIEEKVAAMQIALEKDPAYQSRFEKLGVSGIDLLVDPVYEGETVFGNLVTDLVRAESSAQVMISTASSFRASIPAGPVTVEEFLFALPFRNEVVVIELTGARLASLVGLIASKRTTDGFSQVSGLRFDLGADGRASSIQVAEKGGSSYKPIEPGRSYTVATTDFQASVAPGYREIFAEAGTPRKTGLFVNEVVMRHFRSVKSVTGALDGRIRLVPAAGRPRSAAAVSEEPLAGARTGR